MGTDCSDLSQIPVMNATLCNGGMAKHAHFIKSTKSTYPNTAAVSFGNMCFGGPLFKLDEGVNCGEIVGKSSYDYYNLAY